MKKIAFALMVMGLSSIALTSKAQNEDDKKKEKSKKESQEIIIRRNGNKDARIVVEMNGDKVTVNGKPLSEFKDDNVTINRRNITVWDGDHSFSFSPGEFARGFNWSSDDDKPHAFLGVTTDESEDGAKIVEVSKESAAEKAGLKKGDIITRVGDKKIDGPDELTDVISDMKPKDEVKVHYKRDGKESSVTATLGEKKGGSWAYAFSGPGSARAFSVPRVQGVPFNGGDWKEKLDIEKYSPKAFNDDFYQFEDGIFTRRPRLGIKIQDTEEGNGVKILDVDKDSPAEKAGLKKDDILTEVGGKKVKNTDEAREELHDNAEKASYNVKAKRNGSEMSFDIRIPKKLKTTDL